MTCPSCPRLRRDNTRLRLENDELRRRLALHENPHVPPSVQNGSPGRNRLRPLRKPEERQRPGQKPGHPGVTRAPLVPDQEVPLRQKACSHCQGHHLTPTRVEPKDQIELPPPRQAIVTRYWVQYYRCGDCGNETSATLPGGPLQSGYGPQLKAQVALWRTENRLPIRKILQELRRAGAPMSTATVYGLVVAASERLGGTWEEILARIRRAAVVYADETSFRVDGKKWWLWVFTTGQEVLLVLRGSRGAKVVREILGPAFRGIVVCDGWKSYGTEGWLLQRCWAHLLRVAEKAVEKSQKNRVAVELHGSLLGLYHRLAAALEKEPGREERKRLHRSAQRELRRLCKRYRDHRSPEVRKVATYLKNGMRYWLTFVLHAGVEPTNNRAERALRESVVIRKIIGTLRNEKGARVYERLMSAVATWTMRGDDVWARLIAALQ